MECLYFETATKAWQDLRTFFVPCHFNSFWRFRQILVVFSDYRVSHNYLDWAKYQNRHSSKSIWVMKLFFCQNDCPIRGSFWQKNSFITHILFELGLFWYLAQSTSVWDTLYILNKKQDFKSLKNWKKYQSRRLIYGIVT